MIALHTLYRPRPSNATLKSPKKHFPAQAQLGGLKEDDSLWFSCEWSDSFWWYGTPLKPALAAAAAKSLQSCPTLCHPIDCSPSGSPVPGILQARTLEWVAISFSNAWKWKVKVKSLSCVRLLAIPWIAAYQAPLSMDFPGKSTGVGCHCLLRVSLLDTLILLILLCWSLLICSLLMSKYSRNQFLISSNPLTLSPTHICRCHPKFKPALLKHPKFDPTCPSHKHGTCKAFSVFIGSNSSFPLKAKSLRVTFELSDEVPVNAPQSTIQEKKENYLLSLLISTVQIFSPWLEAIGVTLLWSKVRSQGTVSSPNLVQAWLHH